VRQQITSLWGERKVELRETQFAVNPGRSPEAILTGHATNKRTEMGGDCWPTRASAGEKAPIEAKPGAMPAHDRPRLHHDQHLCPPRPQPPQRYPEPAIPRIQPGTWVLPFKHI